MSGRAAGVSAEVCKSPLRVPFVAEILGSGRLLRLGPRLLGSLPIDSSRSLSGPRRQAAKTGNRLPSPIRRAISHSTQQSMHGLEEKEVGYIAGTPYVGVEVRMKAGPGDGHRGEFTVGYQGRQKVWSINEKFPVWSGVLATAGDVVFYGTMDGWFKAVDAKTGWQFKTSSGIIGQPTTSHYTRANECRKIEALPKFANASYVRSLPSGVSVPSLVRSAFRAVRVVGASAVNVRQWLAGGVLDDDKFLTLFDRVRRGKLRTYRQRHATFVHLQAREE